jgi:hypothetical protein
VLIAVAAFLGERAVARFAPTTHAHIAQLVRRAMGDRQGGGRKLVVARPSSAASAAAIVFSATTLGVDSSAAWQPGVARPSAPTARKASNAARAVETRNPADVAADPGPLL